VTPVTRVPVLTLLPVLLAGAAGAQAPQPGSPVPVAAATTAVATAETAAPAKPDALDPQGFSYNPEGRRDPFVSLLRRGATDSAPTDSKRLAGLAGLGAAEVNLRGTVKSEGAWVGILEGADSKTYIVRAGDKLSDGSIRSITADSMVILQQVNDPLSLQKEQEVRKLLRQTEGK
jgi:type IV pilus assembly protein PilP